MSARTFLALDLNDSILDGLAAAQRALDGCGAKLRPVERDNLHVTLVFLGDVGDELLVDVCDIAAEVAAGTEPFEFAIRGLSAVPARGGVRMVWAGVADPSGRMKLLQAGLAEAMSGLGLKQEERSFSPHITLVRVKSAGPGEPLRRGVQQWAGKDFGSQLAKELTIYESRLTGDGPIYTPLARPPLGQ